MQRINRCCLSMLCPCSWAPSPRSRSAPSLETCWTRCSRAAARSQVRRQPAWRSHLAARAVLCRAAGAASSECCVYSGLSVVHLTTSVLCFCTQPVLAAALCSTAAVGSMPKSLTMPKHRIPSFSSLLSPKVGGQWRCPATRHACWAPPATPPCVAAASRNNGHCCC